MHKPYSLSAKLSRPLSTWAQGRRADAHPASRIYTAVVYGPGCFVGPVPMCPCEQRQHCVLLILGPTLIYSIAGLSFHLIISIFISLNTHKAFQLVKEKRTKIGRIGEIPNWHKNPFVI